MNPTEHSTNNILYSKHQIIVNSHPKNKIFLSIQKHVLFVFTNNQ